MNSRTTLKDVAERAGKHVSTVVRALQNHPRIGAATRKQIQELARDMGYRPDPLLSALAAYRDQKRPPGQRGVIAWLDLADRAESTARKIYHELWTAAEARAGAHGWTLQEFCPHREGMTLDRVAAILRHRGIEGVLVPPLPGEGGEVTFDFSDFCAATVGETLHAPRLHRVSPHRLHNLHLAWDQLHARGYRRPALVLERKLHERVGHQWVAAFLERQQTLPPRDRLPVWLEGYQPAEALAAWMRRQRPDVILAGNPGWVSEILGADGWDVPGEIGIAGVGLWEQADFPGIEQRFGVIGTRVLDLVVAMIHRNERGLPDPPIHILIEGAWRDGNTLRAGGSPAKKKAAVAKSDGGRGRRKSPATR